MLFLKLNMEKMSNQEQDLFISFETLFENAQNSAMLIMDTSGMIIKPSPGFTNSYGYEKKDLKGKSFKLLFTKDDLEKGLPDKELEKALHEKAAADKNFIVHKDGTKVWSHGETILTKDQNGSPFLVKHIYNINKRRLLEESLKKSNAALTKAKNDLDTFVYTASHDLKAPIANLDALFQLLETKIDKEAKEKVSGILEKIKHSIEKFNKTLYDLAEQGKEQAALQQEEDNLIYFTDLMDEIKSSMLTKIEEAKVEFEEDFQEVPAIRFSKKNLRSILFNLISNAIKFRAPLKIPRILVSTHLQENFIQIVVQDNGQGIENHKIEHIFDMYNKLNQNTEGSGLGLNIVKRIVDNNKGKIEVKSTKGTGTTFKIYLKES
jgi:PAS domain S-box-containing protein